MVIRLSTSRANRSCPGTSRQLFARRAAVAVLVSVSWLCHGQAPAARPEIGQYIHNSWDTLSRSMNECKSVVDLKVTTAPILYLPAGNGDSSGGDCHADAVFGAGGAPAAQDQPDGRTYRSLEIPKEGLLYLPNAYVVPGGRFNEMVWVG